MKNNKIGLAASGNGNGDRATYAPDNAETIGNSFFPNVSDENAKAGSTVKRRVEIYLTMQKGIHDHGWERGINSGDVEPNSETELILKEHAKAMAEDAFRDNFNPADSLHDKSRQQEFERCQAETVEAKQALLNEKSKLREAENAASKAIAKVSTGKAKLQVEEISNYIETARKRFSKLNVSLQFEDIVSVQIKFDKLDKLLETARVEKKRVSENAKKFPSQIEKLNAELTELTDQLNQPARQYEKYTKDLQKWKTKEKVIIGDASTPDSLKFVEAAVSEIDTFPVELSRLKRQRREKALLIHSKIENLAQEFQVLYGAVQNFINNDPLAKKLEIAFSVSIVENNFTNTFLDNIDLSRKSIFFRRGGGLDEIVPSIDFNKSEDVKMFLDNVTALLGKVDDLDDIAKTSVIEIYDYLFSLQFLEPRFVLKLFGKGIEQLSSGQRGSLLMIFHLIIDKDDRPLIVDQPEGNLDGQYIYETLVAAIRRAKRNRQVIIVTHNPNLAVCCDSEQIIHASLDREDGNSVSYECGAIEDSRQKQVVVDKLEGTMPGFDNRKVKYAFGLR